MSLSLLLLLFVLHAWSSQATHFFGTVMTYDSINTSSNGSVTVVLRYKLSFHSCSDSDSWICVSGDCGTENPVVLKVVYSERSGEWCQREGVMTRQAPSNAQIKLELNGGNWINNIVNNIVSWKAVTLVELRNRSDTGKANRSPKTTILPAVRVPSNCQRDFNLLAFDPDGDEVKCRYGNFSLLECQPCTPASVLTLSSSCSLSFSPTSSSDQGPYAIQLVMEDFPRQTVTLTQTDGTRTTITTNNTLSNLPVQFVLKVIPAVPSCTEGLYLPKFVTPTPANRARLFASVSQFLEISIKAQTNVSTISELLFSGPYNVNQTAPGSGQFILKWMPSEDQNGESHPICFVVQALFNSMKLHSELRCVIVSVGNEPPSGTTTETPSTTLETTPSTTLETTQSTPSTTLETTPSTSMETTPSTTLETTPSTSMETTPSTTLETTPSTSMETTPSTSMETTPSTTMETTQLTPSTTLETTPSTSMETTQLTPSTTLETTPSTSMETTQLTPSTTLETTPSTTLSTTLETTPSTTLSTTLETTPSTTLSTTLETTPSTTLSTTLETTPSTTLSTTLETTPSTTLSTTLETSPPPSKIVIGLRMSISSLYPLSDDDIRNTLQQLIDQLGLTSSVSLRFVRRV